jgi:hypothetical protein
LPDDTVGTAFDETGLAVLSPSNNTLNVSRAAGIPNQNPFSTAIDRHKSAPSTKYPF